MIIDIDYNNHSSNHNFILKFIGGHKDNNAGRDVIQVPFNAQAVAYIGYER